MLEGALGIQNTPTISEQQSAMMLGKPNFKKSVAKSWKSGEKYS